MAHLISTSAIPEIGPLIDELRQLAEQIAAGPMMLPTWVPTLPPGIGASGWSRRAWLRSIRLSSQTHRRKPQS
jgi:hypothetical protein